MLDMAPYLYGSVGTNPKSEDVHVSSGNSDYLHRVGSLFSLCRIVGQ